MTGYLLIEYGRDENSYSVYLHREDAEKALARKVKEHAIIVGDSKAFYDDDYDASDWIYQYHGEIIFEIAPCIIDEDDYLRNCAV